jgi:hypothetical protein
LRRGQRIGSLYEQQIAQELVWIRDLRGTDPKVDAAKRDNAKSAPKASKVPPTVSAGKGPAPKQSPKIPAFKSAKDADDWLFDEGNYKNL